MSGLQAIRAVVPGVGVAAAVALAAGFIAEHQGGPQLLYALLIGLSLHFLARDARIRPGLDFASRSLLRAGVALLGLRITVGQVGALGWGTAAMVVAGVLTTIAVGLALGRLLHRPWAEGLVSGCAVGICGASAALAVASVLPRTRDNERFTLLAVVGVTLLSTAAMVLYPVLVRMLGWSPAQAGVFFGATIHDVAQVVAAGMMLSSAGDTAAADSATVVKLLRVAMLMPVVMAVALVIRPAPDDGDPGTDVPLIPGFLLAFVALMMLNTTQLVPPELASGASTASRSLLVVAIAAAGLKTRFADLLRLGWVPVILLLAETAWIAALAGLAIAAGLAAGG